jgi:hypothetical protein
MIQKTPDRVPTMSAQEEEYLQDIKGLIDFVIRNRLRFQFVTGALARDIHVLEAHGHNLAAALAAGMRRSDVVGARRLTPDAFGMSDDDEDVETHTQPSDQNHALHEK